MSQKQMIMQHLNKHGDITMYQALMLYRIGRLQARIHELRQQGHKIKSVMMNDDTGKKYCKYVLAA